MKKRVLIISAVMCPRNSPRAHRATELAKEFARIGHEVTLYAMLGTYDYTNFEKKYGVKVKNLGKPLFYPIKSDGEVKTSFLFKIAQKIFNPIIQFPEIELVPLVKQAVLNEGQSDILITNAIPHSIHWGAAWAKSINEKKFPKVWFADCGDPFMGNQFKKPLFYFKYFEKWFCRKCDFITIPIENAKEAYYREFRDKIVVIPQGFQFKDRALLKTLYKKNKKPHFLYAGAFYRDKRDPRKFLRNLSSIDMDFKFIIYTKNASLIKEEINELGDKIEIRDYVPRSELLKVMAKMDFLINFENSTSMQSPSKLIDYFLVDRPVLSVSNNDVSNDSIIKFLKGDYSDRLKMDDVEEFNIINVVQKFLNQSKVSK